MGGLVYQTPGLVPGLPHDWELLMLIFPFGPPEGAAHGDPFGSVH
jgi:hypothetical protein